MWSERKGGFGLPLLREQNVAFALEIEELKRLHSEADEEHRDLQNAFELLQLQTPASPAAPALGMGPDQRAPKFDRCGEALGRGFASYSFTDATGTCAARRRRPDDGPGPAPGRSGTDGHDQLLLLQRPSARCCGRDEWRGHRAVRSSDRAALRAPHRRLFFMGVRAVGRLDVSGGDAPRHGPDDSEPGGRRWSVSGRRKRHRAESPAIVVGVRCSYVRSSG